MHIKKRWAKFKKLKHKKGFTLLEILVVVAVIGVLTAVVLSSIKAQKDKGKDLRVKQTLSDIQVKVADQEIAPGVVDYQSAFNTAKVQETISSLAQVLGVSSTNYSYGAASNEYAIVFPLTTGKYYCVDAQNNTKEVSGLLNTSGPKNCDNATRQATTGGLVGGGPVYVCDYEEPPQGCTYVPGPNYDPVTKCGKVVQCGSGGGGSPVVPPGN